MSPVASTGSAPYLRVSVPAIIAHSLIAPALPRFREQHPDVRVHLVIAEHPADSPRCDARICIRPFDTLNPHQPPLAVVSEVLCASKEFLAVYGQPTNPWELDSQHCIGISADGQQHRGWSFHQGATEVTIVPASSLALGDSRSAVATAVRGGGIILVPALAVEAEIAAGLLTPLLPDWSTPRHAVWLEQHAPRAPRLEAFAHFVGSLFPSA